MSYKTGRLNTQERECKKRFVLAFEDYNPASEVLKHNSSKAQLYQNTEN